MTLSDLANVGEIIGGLAVVISLVYLAIQVRQNTDSVRSATLQTNTALWSSLLSDMADSGTVEAYTIGLSGRKDISPKQYTQFFLLCRGLFAAFENQHYQYRCGILDEETYKGYARAISEQLLAFAGFRIWWEQSRDVFSPPFVKHVDELIRKTPIVMADKYFEQWQSFPRSQESSD
jgi:hypothetical protein